MKLLPKFELHFSLHWGLFGESGGVLPGGDFTDGSGPEPWETPLKKN